jgi:hypothetical protein
VRACMRAFVCVCAYAYTCTCMRERDHLSYLSMSVFVPYNNLYSSERFIVELGINVFPTFTFLKYMPLIKPASAYVNLCGIHTSSI